MFSAHKDTDEYIQTHEIEVPVCDLFFTEALAR